MNPTKQEMIDYVYKHIGPEYWFDDLYVGGCLKWIKLSTTKSLRAKCFDLRLEYGGHMEAFFIHEFICLRDDMKQPIEMNEKALKFVYSILKETLSDNE